MIAAFLACLLAQGKVVTLDSPGWAVPKILDEMSTQTGQKFQAWDDVRLDHVIVHVSNVPLKEFMDRFAKALLSQWTLQDGTYRLDRSPELVAQSEAATRKVFASRIADTLDDYKKLLAEHPKFDEDYARGFSDQLRAAGNSQNPHYFSRIQEVKSSLPLARALKKMVISFGADALAGLPVGKRVVLATQPNSLQLALPPSAMSILAEAVDEEAIWTKTSAGVKVDPGMESMIDLASYQGATGGILSLQAQPLESGIAAELTIFDRVGHILGTTSLQIGIPQFSKNAGNDISKMNGVGTPVPVDSETADGLKSLGIFGGGAKTTAAMRTRLLHPAEYDPLSLFASGCLKALGAQKGENVIAYGDLGLIFSFAAYAQKGIFDTSWTTGPMTQFLENVEEGQGWLTATPNDFDGYLSMRTNRDTLEALFAPGADAGWVTVDAAARFVASENLEVPDMFAEFIASACFGTSSCPLDQFSWALEGIYGMLRPDQLTVAEKSGLTVSMLTSSQQKALLEALLNESIRVNSFTGPATIEASDQVDQSKIETIEPTLAFANGLPPQMILKVAKTTGACIVCNMGSGPLNSMSFPSDPNSIAWNEFVNEHKPEWAAKYSGYQEGMRDQVQVNLNWPGGGAQANFQSSKASGAVVNDWKLLPADIVGEIQKQLADFEKAFKDNPNMLSGPGAERQGTPP